MLGLFIVDMVCSAGNVQYLCAAKEYLKMFFEYPIDIINCKNIWFDANAYATF